MANFTSWQALTQAMNASTHSKGGSVGHRASLNVLEMKKVTKLENRR